MRRWLYMAATTSLLIGSSFITLASFSGDKSASVSALQAQTQHTITVTPWGPDQATIDAAKTRLLASPLFKRSLAGMNTRMLSFDFLESAVKQENPEPPTRYRATFFNYSTNRAYFVDGGFQEGPSDFGASDDQPIPSPEEFEEAVAVLTKDPNFGPGLKDGTLQAYPPMPPLVDQNLPVAKVERTLTVGVMSKDGKASNEIVGVNMIRRTVTHYDGGAPATSLATTNNCGVTSAGQTTTASGTAGQFQITIARGSDTLWEFLCVRPSASSPTPNRSGIELQNVRFRGKLVLARANLPILNVQYYQNFCGPFRDWQWQEGMFTANGTDVAPGIRMCTDEPKTVIDNGTDTGNFRGVAIYDREEVTLVSELNAGWYRYISKWIFHDEGIISPRFGFGATTNSCVCLGHIHHCYWRFDFDVVTAANNQAAEFNQGSLKTMAVEANRTRFNNQQYWAAINSVSGESVIIRPGWNDGNHDKFGHGDVWLLRNHYPAEQDDAGLGSGSDAHIDAMVTASPESINNQDIVIWYGAHWTHDHFDLPPEALGQRLVGPDLILKNY